MARWKFYNFIRRDKAVEDEVCISLTTRSCAGGGCNLPLVLEFDDEEGSCVRPLQPDDGGEITMTLTAERMDVHHMPCVLEMDMQQTTGTLNPGGHPGSYNGQDAYNDMLVVDDDKSVLCDAGIRRVCRRGGGVHQQ